MAENVHRLHITVFVWPLSQALVVLCPHTATYCSTVKARMLKILQSNEWWNFNCTLLLARVLTNKLSRVLHVRKSKILINEAFLFITLIRRKLFRVCIWNSVTACYTRCLSLGFTLQMKVHAFGWTGHYHFLERSFFEAIHFFCRCKMLSVIRTGLIPTVSNLTYERMLKIRSTLKNVRSVCRAPILKGLKNYHHSSKLNP